MSHPAWTDADLAQNPHTAADKARRVREMFAAIAPSYDLNNRLHSLWRDQAWRKAAVKMAEVKATDQVVDVACGTGDLALAFTETQTQDAPAVLGIDFTLPMLPIAQQKAERRWVVTGGGDDQGKDFLKFANGDAMRLPLPDASADVISIAFGIRNVADPARAIREFYRILRPGGRLIVLEFSTPAHPVLRRLHGLYCGRIMPITATWIARDRSGAYKYLPRSVSTFISREGMIGMMREAGFTEIASKSLTFGIAVCYRGVKR